MIEIDYKSDLPIYEQIIEQFKLNIMKGNFKAGAKVISVRKMAAMLDITPSTVAKAYAELERQGVSETIRAKGAYIACHSTQPSEIIPEKVTKKLRSEIIELKHSGYSLQDIQQIINELYDSI